MNNIIKIQYIQKYDNLVNITINLLSKCNLKCSYCYNNSYIINNDKYQNINALMFFLKKINKPMAIEIIGGEPTLHPDLYDFCKNINENDNVKNVVIYTNGMQSINFYKRFVKLKKISFIISAHNYLLQNIKKLIIFSNMCNVSLIKVMFENTKITHIKKIFKQIHKKIKLYYITSKNYLYSKQYINYYNYLYTNNICHADTNLIITDKAGNKKNISNENYTYDSTIQQFNFYRWKCYAGLEQLYIHYDGTISYCESYYLSTKKYFSTIFSFNKQPHGLLCPLKTCWCPSLSTKERIFK